MRAWALAVLAAGALTACGKELPCRPGTIFVELTSTAALAGVTDLAITVVVNDTTLTASLPYSGGNTLEIVLDERYKPGVPFVISIAALANDNEQVRFEQSVGSLPASCTTLRITPPDLDLSTLGDLTTGEDLHVEADLAPPLLANGAVCSGGASCESGFCVDGRCCNATCDGQCEACDVPTLEGVCAPVSGAPHGGRTACAGSGVCVGVCGGAIRNACVFPSPSTICRTQSCAGGMKTKPNGCDGAGECAAAETITCPQGCSGDECMGACMNDGECAAATPSMPYCDAGVCTAKRPNGRTCGGDADCTSNHCADGYCCSSACDNQCDSCAETGTEGICVRITGQPRTGSTPARTDCAGAGVCKGQCDGTAPSCVLPTSSTACGAVSCANGQLTAVGACNAGSCTQMTTDCPNGNCGSATACGPCTDNGQCGTGRWCDSGTCRATTALGTTCTVDDSCTSGNCETAAGGTGKVCCKANCGLTQPRCAADFNSCICTSSSCAAGQVCHSTTKVCCACASGCRGVSTCGGACTANCASCCGCGAGGQQCCSGVCP